MARARSLLLLETRPGAPSVSPAQRNLLPTEKSRGRRGRRPADPTQDARRRIVRNVQQKRGETVDAHPGGERERGGGPGDRICGFQGAKPAPPGGEPRPAGQALLRPAVCGTPTANTCFVFPGPAPRHVGGVPQFPAAPGNFGALTLRVWAILMVQTAGRIEDAVSHRDAGGEHEERGKAYVCGFCRHRFSLEPGEQVSIRFVGRIPQVECPACRRAWEASETAALERVHPPL